MKFLRNQFMPIILFIVLIISMISGIYQMNIRQNWINEQYEKGIAQCKDFQGNYEDEHQKQRCEEIMTEDYRYTAFIDFYSMHDSSSLLPLSSSFILIILIIICGSYYPCRQLKNKSVSNYITRENYSEYRKKLFLNAQITTLVVPIMMIINIAISYLYTRNWDLTDSFDIGNSLFIYLISSITITFFIISTLINISLIISRKQHNFILSSVVSFLTILAIELALECVVNPIINTLTNSDIGHIFNILSFGPTVFDAYGYLPPIIFSLSTATISYIIARLAYKDKEKLIIDCEAN